MTNNDAGCDDCLFLRFFSLPSHVSLECFFFGINGATVLLFVLSSYHDPPSSRCCLPSSSKKEATHIRLISSSRIIIPDSSCNTQKKKKHPIWYTPSNVGVGGINRRECPRYHSKM